MVGRALPEIVKKMNLSDERERQYGLALDELEAHPPERGAAAGRFREVASHYTLVQAPTLRNRYLGMRSIREVNAGRQKVSTQDEAVLVDHINNRAIRGIPLSQDEIRSVASRLLQPGVQKLGENWVSNFMYRKRKVVKMYKTTHLDRTRANGLHADAVKSFEDVIEAEIVEAAIAAGNVYAMDETSFNQRNDSLDFRAGPVGQENQYQIGSEQQENITVIVTICGDGSTLSPTIVFAAKNIDEVWYDKNPANAA